MVAVSFVAFALTLSGFVVIVQSLLTRRGLPSLEHRGIDSHLWGYHLLSAGLVVGLGAWILGERAWEDLARTERGMLLAGVVWVGIALGFCAAALCRRAVRPPPRAGARRGGIPGPGVPLRRWPPVYRLFLALGFVVLISLAALAALAG